VKDAPFIALDRPAGGATVFTCALCGSRFTHGRQTCGSCPLNSGCEVVACPECGHSFPRRSAIVSLLRRVFGRREKESP